MWVGAFFLMVHELRALVSMRAQLLHDMINTTTEFEDVMLVSLYLLIAGFAIIIY